MANVGHLSLGAVVKAAPLTYVEAWTGVHGYTVRKIYFDWRGMEALIALTISVEMFDGDLVTHLRFSVPGSEQWPTIEGIWKSPDLDKSVAGD